MTITTITSLADRHLTGRGASSGGCWTHSAPMRYLLMILLAVTTGCNGQETNGITKKVIEHDKNKDGKPDIRIETVFRHGERIMVSWSKPDAKGDLRVSSRSYFVGGDMVTTESDDDKDGIFKTFVVYRAGSKEIEVFSRQRDGLVAPVSGQSLAAYKKQLAAINEFWDKALDTNTSIDKSMQLMEET